MVGHGSDLHCVIVAWWCWKILAASIRYSVDIHLGWWWYWAWRIYSTFWRYYCDASIIDTEDSMPFPLTLFDYSMVSTLTTKWWFSSFDSACYYSIRQWRWLLTIFGRSHCWPFYSGIPTGDIIWWCDQYSTFYFSWRLSVLLILKVTDHLFPAWLFDTVMTIDLQVIPHSHPDFWYDDGIYHYERRKGIRYHLLYKLSYDGPSVMETWLMMILLNDIVGVDIRYHCWPEGGNREGSGIIHSILLTYSILTGRTPSRWLMTGEAPKPIPRRKNDYSFLFWWHSDIVEPFYWWWPHSLILWLFIHSFELWLIQYIVGDRPFDSILIQWWKVLQYWRRLHSGGHWYDDLFVIWKALPMRNSIHSGKPWLLTRLFWRGRWFWLGRSDPFWPDEGAIRW